MVETHEYHFDVKMSCSSCSGAIERVLGKLDGVQSFDVSLEKQTVDVRATVPFETVLEKIKKTGKEIVDSKVIA
ncbi:Cytosolic copper metallochaperone [Malassezia sympodialis ATCC 42132]|uniref:Cytosolic copper metallochaperone n=1 Tax=Malassezia sympodialis (strain ATCC 42132) TaxID=1230383 RepID=A0A1M8A4Z7_MALS4|nr:Cytosolic copper metallochaperone [Malassezia sympodialis ATCC 42132]